jgi:glycosyltransferase involved in cell wall biosynthesis
LQQRRRFSQIAGRAATAKLLLAEQTEALEAFRIAHARGARTFLMMTGQAPGARERWLAGEAARWGGRSPGHAAVADRVALLERERAEIVAADVIVSPSPLVTETLAEEPAARNHQIVEVDWPVWAEDFEGARVRSRTPKGSLHVLFAGSVGLQKGVLYLAEALEAMKDAALECRFVGGVALPGFLAERCANVGSVLGHVPASEMAGHFAWAHVLVLPSLSEGRARVGLEALAAGVPVIATPNAGLPISHGFDGLIVPPRDSAAIRTALERLLNESGLLETLSTNGVAHARELTLDRYAGQLKRVVEACR